VCVRERERERERRLKWRGLEIGIFRANFGAKFWAEGASWRERSREWVRGGIIK
jgi:hypothetical protein